MSESASVVAGLGVEVFVDTLDDAPWCPHGPTLMFERFYQDRESRRFYACSAHRKRSGCSFFQWADEKESDAKRQMRMEIYQAAQDAEVAHQKLYGSVKSVVQKASTAPTWSSVCTTCACLVGKKESALHREHKVVDKLMPTDLVSPTQFLPAMEDSHSHAQYVFSGKAVSYLLNQLQTLGIRHVVCIGAPRLHETIVASRLSKKSPLCSMRSFLLDWDRRFAAFFSPKEFQHFNMFNRHFFNAEHGLASLAKFLGAASMSEVAVVMDPPFGGLARPLAACVEWLCALATKHCKKDSGESGSSILTAASTGSTCSLATVWVFPYFLESHIQEAMPCLKMMDYKVDYDNHPLFTSVGRKKAEKRKSPVRLFTNVVADKLLFPEQEGYTLCKPCKRYVSAENRHCNKCHACTTKHGPAYVHCASCKACVKPGRVHCDTCKQCLPSGHDCHTGGDVEGAVSSAGPVCHRCGKAGHKRRHCPDMDDSSQQGRPKAKRTKR